ncbi:Putative amidase AmiD [Paenibacillus auburnensis]|uniref:Amidase AmiD n=1 Tax=Paenibacillus auburnensis TaxID=2905649 RepID=A0ABM9BN18_9BACL|nr:amidase family protein [Paenibacillus auburnensis]CAH1191059.1 Putative amidase AmiD [Paenibacillus auburnensis]
MNQFKTNLNNKDGSLAFQEWIIEADIAAMQAEMNKGSLTAEQLVSLYLDRINRYDSLINSVLELNPDALDIARQLDKERQLSGARSSLHGIPLLIKDNIDTADKLHTSAGSIALAESTAVQDAAVISRLRTAGAIILGKANMTEWANFMAPGMWAGYSSRGGLVLNPYGPGELFVGGSSSGSAASVAANLIAAAVGTETSGSIIGPASQNCIVGIKPTAGLVSMAGIIPGIGSQDTAGPLARTVSDAAVLLGAMTGQDEPDTQVSGTARERTIADYTVFLDTAYLQGVRIGIPRAIYHELDEEVMAIMAEAIELLEQQGAVIVDPVELPCLNREWSPVMLQYEFKRGLNQYLAGLAGSVPVHSLSELIAYNNTHSDKALKYGQGTLEWLEQSGEGITEEMYLEQLRLSREQARDHGIDYALKEYQLDALMFPGFHGTDLAARAGYPLITVPAGFAANGIVTPGGYLTKGPHGVTFSGTAFSEPTLISIAYGFEQASRRRFPPRLSK